MLRLIADENLKKAIVVGVLRLLPDLDLMVAQDVGLTQTDDRVILEWAATNDRLVVTHDVTTMSAYAYDRVQQGLPMPGVIEIPDTLPIGLAIDELATFVACSHDDEWDEQVIFLPL